MRCWKNLCESFLCTCVGLDSISQLFHFNLAWPKHQLSEPLSWCYSPNLTRKIKRNISYIVTSSQYFLSPANSKKRSLKTYWHHTSQADTVTKENVNTKQFSWLVVCIPTWLWIWQMKTQFSLPNFCPPTMYNTCYTQMWRVKSLWVNIHCEN